MRVIEQLKKLFFSLPLFLITFLFLFFSPAQAVGDCNVFGTTGPNFYYENLSGQDISTIAFVSATAGDVMVCQGGSISSDRCTFAVGEFPTNSARRITQGQVFESGNIVCTFADGSEVNATPVESLTVPPPTTNQPPNLSVPREVSSNTGEAYTGAGLIGDLDSTTWTGSINYGDGSGDQPLVITGNDFAITHTYTAPGNYVMTLRVTDEQGNSSTALIEMTVTTLPSPNHCYSYDFRYENTHPTLDIVRLTFAFSHPGDIVSCQNGTATDTGCTYAAGAFPPETTRSVTQQQAFGTATCTFSDGSEEPVIFGTGPVIVNSPPVIAAIPNQTIEEGATYLVDGSLTDPDSPSWTGTIDYKDGSAVQSLTINPDGTFHLSHVYVNEGNFRPVLTIFDYEGAAVTKILRVNVDNAPPVVSTIVAPADPVRVGTEVVTTASFTDPGVLDVHTAEWNWGDGTTSAATLSESNGSGTVSGTHTYTAPGQYSVSVTVSDDGGMFGSSTFEFIVVVVDNSPPVVGAITAPSTPTQVGTAVTASASFTDPDLADTHTALWDWGDGTTSVGTVTESNGAGTVSDSHIYTTPGVYTLNLVVTDASGASASATPFEYVVVYDPSAGFVTGAGLITSQPGSYLPDPAYTGKALFGFVSRYRRGASVPDGTTQFKLFGKNFHFQSATYQWLIVNGARAQYRGTGTVNGASGYSFLLTAIDGRLSGGPDRLRVKIWNTATGEMVYDNQVGAPDSSDPSTAIDAGAIVIHR